MSRPVVWGLLFGLSVYHPQSLGAQEVWELSEDPVLVLGTLDGPSPTVFDDIRGASFVSDDMIVIGDGSSRQLRVFRASGEFVRAFGREGDGPMEFRGLAWTDVCGEGLVFAYDFLRRRVSKWDLDGNLLDAFPVEGTRSDLPPYSVSCGPDGDFVVIGWPDIASVAATVGPYRPEMTVGRADGQGRMAEIVGTFPGTERYRTENNDGPRPLGRVVIGRMGEQAVYVGTADSLLVERIGFDGRRTTFGNGERGAEVTEEVRRAWVESLAAKVPEARRPDIRRAFRDFGLPDHLPAYADFQIDRAGLIWIGRFPVPGLETTTWEVFDQRGAEIASIVFPASFRPTYLGLDKVLGVYTDSLDVERVHLYRLIRR